MGLAAGQARLLTITGRKSDCEFESMRLSHQKIALARDLAALSNEYQNSLNQTKLVYDFYGTGDTALDLSYGVLMTPSALNKYSPKLVTDSMNRVVLNSKYARAAEAAGIPREGLGTLPSETMRNKFILALADMELDADGNFVYRNPSLYPDGKPIITEFLCKSIVGSTKDGIMGVPYNQNAGLGGDLTTNIVTKEMSLSDLCDFIYGLGESANFSSLCSSDVSHIKGFNIIQLDNAAPSYEYDEGIYRWVKGGNNTLSSDINIDGSETISHTYTLGDIIRDYLDGKSLMLEIDGQDDHNNVTGFNGIVDYMCNLNLWDQMYDTFESLFDDGTAATQLALQSAREKIQKMLTNPSVGLGNYIPDGSRWNVGTGDASVSDQSGTAICAQTGRSSGFLGLGSKNLEASNAAPDGTNDFDTVAAYIASKGGDWNDSEVHKKINSMTSYVGMCVVENNDNHGSSDNDSDMSAGCINLSRMIMAYLTEFYIQMNGTNAGDYHVQKGHIDDNKFLEGSEMFAIVDREVSSDTSALAGFYDAIFNMLCKNGWCENEHIDEKEYLQNMLKNGMVYLSEVKDDGYYYQGNYATDAYIKEIADETLIAKAEAKYNTEKAKLNAKEETLDLKMKNLDTEISSLTTEYDTVKNTISKNIEKSFKRYNA